MDKPDKLPEIKKVDSQTRAAQRAQEAAKRTAAARQKVLLVALAVAVAANALIAYLLHGVMVEDVQRQRQAELTEQQTRQHADAVQRYLAKVT